MIDADPIDQAIKLRINNAIGDTIGPSAVLLIIAGIIKRATNGATKKDPIMKSMLFKKPAYRNDHIKIDRERIIITICIKRKNLPPFAPLNIPGLLYSGIIGLIDMSAKPWNREARIIIKLALIVGFHSFFVGAERLKITGRQAFSPVGLIFLLGDFSQYDS